MQSLSAQQPLISHVIDIAILLHARNNITVHFTGCMKPYSLGSFSRLEEILQTECPSL